MTSSLCPRGPNSHAPERCILGMVVFLRPGETPRLPPELQCPKCAKVGRARARERREFGSHVRSAGTTPLIRAENLGTAGIECWCGGDGEVQGEPFGEPWAPTRLGTGWRPHWGLMSGGSDWVASGSRPSKPPPHGPAVLHGAPRLSPHFLRD